jgi:hypothetical protein
MGGWLLQGEWDGGREVYNKESKDTPKNQESGILNVSGISKYTLKNQVSGRRP